jgi:hypothetical protein
MMTLHLDGLAIRRPLQVQIPVGASEIYEPDSLAADFDKAPLDFVSTKPAIDCSSVSSDAVGIFLYRGLFIVLAWDIAGPDWVGCAKSTSLQ